jgi:hypothetical protein
MLPQINTAKRCGKETTINSYKQLVKAKNPLLWVKVPSKANSIQNGDFNATQEYQACRPSITEKAIPAG